MNKICNYTTQVDHNPFLKFTRVLKGWHREVRSHPLLAEKDDDLSLFHRKSQVQRGQIKIVPLI